MIRLRLQVFLNRLRTHPYFAPTIFFILALAVRLFRLTAQSLWLDEGGTWDTITTRSWGDLLADLGSARAGYPLYHLLMKGWIAVAGESEWALRLPSALAGALAVVLLYQLGRRLGGARVGVVAATLLLLNPFALWLAQDAKAYSLLLALAVWSLLALVNALEHGGRRCWLLWIAMLVLLLLTHRLALLLVIGEVTLVAWHGSLRGRWRRVVQFVPFALVIGLGFGLYFGLRQDPNAPPIGANVNPITALRLLLERFTVDRTETWTSALMIIFLLGFGLLWRHNDAHHVFARRLILATFALPLGLFLLALAAGAPLFEPRYVSFLLPLWVLPLAWLFKKQKSESKNQKAAGATNHRPLAPSPKFLAPALLALVLAGSIWALLAQPYGLWSGAAVKEDYRGAISALARRVVPGDVVVVHPPYIGPLYRYYAPRVSPDALPPAVAFGRVGALGYDQKEFDNDYSALLAGVPRGWLLIAPDNARTVDPPNPRFPQDDMGRVGINFLTADLNNKWRCLDEPYRSFNGLRVMCQSFPAPLQPNSLEMAGAWPIPTSNTATWNNALDLLGFQFASWSSGVRAGGTLPISLTWQTRMALPTDLRMFVHLVPAIGAPVAAQLDAAPLGGGLPTTRWPLDQPIHDEIAVPLPATIPTGTYIVVLGWYDPGIPDVEAQRLPVTAQTGAGGANYIELGTVEVK